MADSASNRPAAEGAPFQYGKVLALSGCHFIHDVYSSFLAPLLPLLIEKLSMTLTQAGILTALMQVPALFNPLIGSLADRTSTRYLVILAPVATAVPMSLIGLAPSYGVLLILLMAAGVSIALFHVPAPVMVSRVSGSRVGRGMSFFMTGGELARTVGPMAAVGAVSLFGLEGFWPIMVVGMAASAFLYVKLRDIPTRTQSARKISLGGAWREIRHVMVPLMAILVSRAFMHASMSTYLPTFIEMETGNLWLAGFGLTAYEAAGVLGVLTAGTLSDRFGRRTMLLISLVGAPLSLMIFVAAGGWLRVAVLLVIGFTVLSTTPVMLALVQETAKESPSSANGFFMMSSFLARAAVVPLVGLMGDVLGLQTAYLISAFLGLFSLPFILRLPK